MCGIFICLRSNEGKGAYGALDSPKFSTLCDDLRRYNTFRGPDNQQNIVIDVQEKNGSKVSVDFYGAELHLRGSGEVKQPHQKDGNILCWNGEVSVEENDGVKLMEALASLKTEEQIRDLLGSFRLEVFRRLAANHTDKAETQRLYFARDPLGRRSLLIHKPTQNLPCFLVSSVSSGSSSYLEFEEVPTDFVYCLNLSEWEGEQPWLDFESKLKSIPRESTTTTLPFVSSPYVYSCRLNDALPPDDLPTYEPFETVPSHLTEPVERFLEVLDDSVRSRIENIPKSSHDAASARLSVLFSGGIDSTVVTFLAHKYIPIEEPIDLFNVAFENPRKIRIAQEGNIGGLPRRQKAKGWKGAQAVEEKPAYSVPDRKTGLQELEELRRLCPGRKWNFVEVNVPYEASGIGQLAESQAAKEIIQNLMLPSKTVMDLVSSPPPLQTLAMALYFASRGKGTIPSGDNSPHIPYTSPAKVVLSGLGSDELLGGYGRHRSAFNSGGWKAIIEELQLEIDRIPKRNLGRDDRIISTHGKETRHPFLSLDVVSFLAKLPVHYKLDPRLEVGKGDKTLLRIVAHKLGLVEASTRKKRAMQFGSHSARMDGERRGDADLE
ncbi:asparagine synthase [Coprinopsis sp. MPI-PUGE-AT-0042]|nr:asparagine synthase [Coprinopsis sp. MPI-PUGE-AT-0042]